MKSGPGQISVQKSKFANSAKFPIRPGPTDEASGHLYHIVAAEAVPERQNIKNHVLLFCQGSGGASGNLYQVSAPSKVATTDITAGHASSKPMSATQCVASAHVGASLPAGAGKELVVQYRCMPPPSAARV